MTIKIDHAKCCYCGGCVGICPKDALELQETKIHVDHQKCVHCGSCVKFCPVDAISDQK